MFWTSGAQHMRWLAYEVPAWFISPIHCWVHSCTSYTEMGPIWGSRSPRHDFGEYISTQTLLLWVPLFPRHQEASNFFYSVKNWLPTTKWLWPEALEQSISSLHQLVHLRYFIKWCKSWVRHLPGRCVVKFRIIDINCLNTTLEI